MTTQSKIFPKQCLKLNQKSEQSEASSSVVTSNCTCGSQSGNLNTKNIGLLIDDIMSKVDQKGKNCNKIPN